MGFFDKIFGASDYQRECGKLLSNAQLLHKRGEFADAERSYKKALKHALVPSFEKATILLNLSSLTSDKRPLAAIHYAEEAIEFVCHIEDLPGKDDMLAQLNHNCGVASFALGRNNDGNSYFFRAIDYRTSIAEDLPMMEVFKVFTYLSWASCLAKVKMIDEAFQIVQEAVTSFHGYTVCEPFVPVPHSPKAIPSSIVEVFSAASGEIESFDRLFLENMLSSFNRYENYCRISDANELNLLSGAYVNLAKVLKGYGVENECVKVLHSAIDNYVYLNERKNNLYQFEHGEACILLSDLYFWSEKYNECLKYVECGEPLLKRSTRPAANQLLDLAHRYKKICRLIQ